MLEHMGASGRGGRDSCKPGRVRRVVERLMLFQRKRRRRSWQSCRSKRIGKDVLPVRTPNSSGSFRAAKAHVLRKQSRWFIKPWSHRRGGGGG